MEIKREVERGSTFYAYERPFIQCFYFICERKFYPRTHVKITRQWKSTLRLATCIVKLVVIKDYWSALVSSLKISKLFSAKRTINRLREHCSLSRFKLLLFLVSCGSPFSR